MVSHRSTKGASKARRDHINHEIRNMRGLLPIAQEDQERLSYLHSMAAICTYIRKSVLFRGLQSGDPSPCPLPGEAFLQALHGFILVTTGQGKLVYVSENVQEYLGISMVDVLQGDSVYDMVERSDVDVVKANLDAGLSSSPERSFICCMHTSKAFKLQHGSCCPMLVRGSFQPPSASPPLFVALCTPTANRCRSSDARFCHSFSSSHTLDMTFTQASDSVVHFLGYSAEEVAGRSWYGLLHPEDLLQSADSHRSLMQADEDFEVEMVLRLQGKDLSWTWIYIQAQKDPERQAISCTNFIISETEGRFLRRKISSDAFRPSSLLNPCHYAAQHVKCSCDATGLKRQRSSNSHSEEPLAKARRQSEDDRCYISCASSPTSLGDSGALFTPPYSPASSSSPLMDVHGYADQLLSSPESSPSYYSYPEAVLTCHRSPSDSLPVAAEQTFDRAAFGVLATPSPPPSSSPAYDFPACTSDARLVPDSLSVSDLCASPVDCALHRDDFGLLEPPQEGSLIQFHHVPQHALPGHSSLLTPNQSPASAGSIQYSEREQAEISILAEQISSLASNFDMYHTLNPLQNASCKWPGHTPLLLAHPLKTELVLDDGVFDSILKDLDMATRKSNASSPGEVPFSFQQLEQEHVGLATVAPEDQFAAMDAFGVQVGHPDQSTGLHQLNQFMQSSLQPDGLTEENLY